VTIAIAAIVVVNIVVVVIFNIIFTTTIIIIAIKLYTVALVSKRTIPTERPPLVGEVSANFLG
jgi:hypothetical protein